MTFGLGGKNRENRGNDSVRHGHVLGLGHWTETAFGSAEVDL